jgi:hypothetical protein
MLDNPTYSFRMSTDGFRLFYKLKGKLNKRALADHMRKTLDEYLMALDVNNRQEFPVYNQLKDGELDTSSNNKNLLTNNDSKKENIGQGNRENNITSGSGEI